MVEGMGEFVSPQLPERTPTPRRAFEGSSYMNMREIRQQEGKQFAVLFTDIDNTFWRADKSEATKTLAQVASEKNYPIVTVTGNDVEMLTGSGDVSILVGGAKKETTAALDEKLSEVEQGLNYKREGNKVYYRGDRLNRFMGPESINRVRRVLEKLEQRSSRSQTA